MNARGGGACAAVRQQVEVEQSFDVSRQLARTPRELGARAPEASNAGAPSESFQQLAGSDASLPSASASMPSRASLASNMARMEGMVRTLPVSLVASKMSLALASGLPRALETLSSYVSQTLFWGILHERDRVALQPAAKSSCGFGCNVQMGQAGVWAGDLLRR